MRKGEQMKLSIYSKLERVKAFIEFFTEKYKPICCLCGFKMDWKVFFPKFSKMSRDNWTIHHLDHNRENNSITNLDLCHRDCHRRHHREEQIFKKYNPNQKYVYRAYLWVGQKKTKIYKV
jgi:hypothetical protein